MPRVWGAGEGSSPQVLGSGPPRWHALGLSPLPSPTTASLELRLVAVLHNIFLGGILLFCLPSQEVALSVLYSQRVLSIPW